jgi:hypothetical protein
VGATSPEAGANRLRLAERVAAAVAGRVLVIVGVVLVLKPPTKKVALAACPNAAAGCVVTVGGDVDTFGTALAIIGAVGGLVALLGVRFRQVKVGEFGLSGFDEVSRA